MNIFFIYKIGVYGHGVHGIFSTKEDAIAGCNTCAGKDKDDYHEWQVIEAPHKKIPEADDILGDGFGHVVYFVECNSTKGGQNG